MPEAICNTSPLLYLHRIGALEWLPKVFSEIWVPSAVVDELTKGQQKGYDVPTVSGYTWLRVVDPYSMPSEWLTLDLGAGELAALALALENPSRVVLLDDALARRIAQAAGLNVWGTLKILLEAKSQGLAESDVALLTYTEAVSGISPGRPISYTGKVTMVYVKQGEMWRGVHYHESVNPKAP